MYNIIDYIKWRGDISFENVGAGEVDNLIFSELSYLDLSDIATPQGITLKEARDIYFEQKRDDEHRKLDKTLANELCELLGTAADSNRFGNIRLFCYEENSDLLNAMQFSATALEIDSKTIIIAFRGTDSSITGWKEDFMMSTLDVIPSQLQALAYTKKIAAFCPDSKIILCGHSKGGNLAVYSAVNSPKEIKERITAIYNFDGPGFKESVLKTPQYLEISDKITTIVPQSSVIGMLFEHVDDYMIVESRQVSLFQHDAFNWSVLGGSFVKLEEVTKSIKFADKTMRGLINGLNDEQKERVVDAIFDVIGSGGKATFADVRKAGLKNVPQMVKAYDELDKETKKSIGAGISLLLSQAIHSGYDVNVSEERKKQLNSLRENFKNKFARSDKKQ